MLNVEELQKVREYLIYKGGLAVEDILRDGELLQQLGIDQANITLKDMENVLSGFDWELEYLKERLHNIEYLMSSSSEQKKYQKQRDELNREIQKRMS